LIKIDYVSQSLSFPQQLNMMTKRAINTSQTQHITNGLFGPCSSYMILAMRVKTRVPSIAKSEKRPIITPRMSLGIFLKKSTSILTPSNSELIVKITIKK